MARRPGDEVRPAMKASTPGDEGQQVRPVMKSPGYSKLFMGCSVVAGLFHGPATRR